MLAVDWAGAGAFIAALTAAVVAIGNMIRQRQTHEAVEETKATIGEVASTPDEPTTLGDAIRDIRHDLRTVAAQVDHITRELNGDDTR